MLTFYLTRVYVSVSKFRLDLAVNITPRLRALHQSGTSSDHEIIVEFGRAFVYVSPVVVSYLLLGFPFATGTWSAVASHFRNRRSRPGRPAPNSSSRVTTRVLRLNGGCIHRNGDGRRYDSKRSTLPFSDHCGHRRSRRVRFYFFFGSFFYESSSRRLPAVHNAVPPTGWP